MEQEGKEPFINWVGGLSEYLDLEYPGDFFNEFMRRNDSSKTIK